MFNASTRMKKVKTEFYPGIYLYQFIRQHLIHFRHKEQITLKCIALLVVGTIQSNMKP